MRFLGRKSSSSGPKAICRVILNKFIPSTVHRSRCGRSEDGEGLAIPTKLIKLEDVATSTHMSLVELATVTVKNRQSKKCRTTLMISDASVELLLNKQKLFAVGLDQVVTCFSLPSEPRAFALVYKRDGADGYCCASLMLNDALTSLTGWEVWEMLIRKQLFFTISESNRKFSAQAQVADNACHDTSSMSSLGHTLSWTSTGSLTSSQQLDSFSISTLISVTSFDPLDSISLSAESALMEQTSIISSSIILSDLSSGTSITSCQNDAEPLTSETDYSCSDEGEEACLESDAEESASDDSNEALNCSGYGLMSRISCSDSSDEIGASAACESNDSENGSEEDSSESDLTFNSDTSQWTLGSESDSHWHWSWDSSDFKESGEAYSSNKMTDSDSDSHSSCDSDKSDEADSNDRATDSDSDSHSSYIYGENAHNSDCNENDGTDSNDRATDSDSDSHSSWGENTHNSDCNKKFNDEADSKDRMTDSDSDSCSCSSCCCLREECCSHESDSDVCRHNSESYSADPAQLVDNACHDASSVSSLGCTLSSTSIGSLTSSQQLDSSSQISTLTSVTSLGSLDSNSLSAESALMEQTSIISSSIILLDLSSGTSITSCQYDAEPLTSEADYRRSDEGEVACLEFDAEESDSNEALNYSGCGLMSQVSCSDFSDETGAGANSCENDHSGNIIKKDSESDLTFNSDTSQWTLGSEGEPHWHWSCWEYTNSSDCEEPDSKVLDRMTDSDSDSHSSYGENAHNSDCNENDETDSNDRAIDSDRDSHSSCDENTHNSDCDEIFNDETDSKDRMTDSDSDSCSCSSCCCSYEECCSHESDSDVCYDSESYSSSDSDYGGDDEDDDDGVMCQPAARITGQYSNMTLKLIHVQNVGLVVMAVSKSDLDSDSGRKSVEGSGSLQRLRRLGKEISSALLKLTCYDT